MTKTATQLARKIAHLLRAMARSRLIGLAALTMTVTVASLGICSQAQEQRFFEKGSTPSFTANQVDRGKAAYGNRCLSCHGANLDGGEFGPTLKGAAFKQHWGGQSAGALFSYLMSRMPPSDPGTLGQQTYADLEAYVLQANGLAPGTTELTAAELGGSGAQGGQKIMRKPNAPVASSTSPA